MTLVLPYGGDQITNNPLFTGSGSVRNTNMPCVFDGDALDFESALMRDWTTDISDYDTPSEDSSLKTPSDANDLKRKISVGVSDSHPSYIKKPRIEEEAATPLQSGIVSSSSSTGHENTITTSISSFVQTPLDNSGASSSSSSSSDGQEDDPSAEVDDEDYVPRRRGPQMWNSRQRWKDERKKVLKMSINKLAEIEDPELSLLRSVLINNTIKKLHLDIRNERQAKLRHRQQRMDYFAERFQPLTNTLGNDVSSNHFASNFDSNGSSGRCTSEVKQSANNNSTNTSDLYDETSCDEIFGISEDFLRVTIPDRRVSSPIPTSPVNQSCLSETVMDTSESNSNNSEETMDTIAVTSRTASDGADSPTSCYTTSSPSCDSAVDCASPYYNRRIQNNSQTVTSMSSSSSSSAVFPPSSPSPNRRLVTSGGSQCATQFRTNRELAGSSNGEGTFPPRVPILDSVVYHSLLASLESS